MASTEQVQLTQSSSLQQHYYSGQKYFNNDIIANKSHNRYGSFTNNRKHFRNKIRSKSSSSLHQKRNINQQQTNNNNNNVPFSQYTPDPYYNILPNESLSSMNININPNDYYINSKDDISSINSNDDESCGEEEEEELLQLNGDNSNNTTNSNGVDLDDSSSNCSFHSSSLLSKDSKISTTTQDVENMIEKDNRESSHHPLLGMTLVTISALCYAGLNLSVKALMFETPWQELMFIRMTITWIATLIWMLIQYRGKMKLCGPKKQRILLSLRAFFLWGAMFACWWSFEFLPVGDGTTLAMSFPVWVSIFAHFLWRNDRGDGHNSSQRLDLFGWICVLAGLLGIAFVAQPSFIFGETDGNSSSHRDVGIAIGCAAAMCSGAQYVLVNYTKKDCHWLQVEQVTAALSVFVFCPIGAIAFALYDYKSNNNRFIIPWQGLDGPRWCEEIALGLLGFLAIALLTRGSQLDAPARTAICLYLQIPFVYIGQCIMTRSFPDVYVFIGIFLVIVSVVVPAVRKLRKANKLKKLKKHIRRKENNNINGIRSRSISNTSHDEYDDDETIPLIQEMDGHVGMGGISGVTVDMSSEEESTGNTEYDDDETIPLIQEMDGHVGMGGISGVTVDMSSEEESTGNTDIDDDDSVYHDIEKVVL